MIESIQRQIASILVRLDNLEKTDRPKRIAQAVSPIEDKLSAIFDRLDKLEGAIPKGDGLDHAVAERIYKKAERARSVAMRGKTDLARLKKRVEELEARLEPDGDNSE